MDADTQPVASTPVASTPWYLKGKTLLITAGALAAALLGVINLWDRVFPADPGDVARVESVVLTKLTSLGDFTSADLGKDLHLEPAPEGAGAPRMVADLGAWGRNSAVTPSAPPSDPAHPAATDTPAPTPTDTPTPGPETPTVPPTSDTPTPTFTESPLERLVRQRPTLEYIQAVGDQPVLSDYEDGVADRMPGVAFNLTVDAEAEGNEGKQVPPEELATILAEAFAEVEAIEDPTGLDPLGWTVAVRLNLEGVKGVPVLLTWSLDGVDVPENWKADKLAYRVIASTPHDAGSVELWIPDLSVPGTYNVNVKLVFESNGETADIATLTLPED
ncbi:hypothetical protein [Mycetocola miduiensis]|uniref:Uncharacterized protein n=1 Tax=Mycetocola miduiensis TaxID=995034 RepID=A0A1I5CTW7_9MICO|nr:hypothetical protein [Mycetocola miduiensis]SFN90384.1 hypothetical protein SAMN05216219_2565 [Mycetocola miduiensis]